MAKNSIITDKKPLQNRTSENIPSFADALKIWWKIALLSFGGPAGQIALMHRYLVDENAWVSDEKFLRALNFTMLLPGPEAQQLATYIGWTMHGVRGGLAAGGLFILPGMIVMMLLSIIYISFGDSGLLEGLFFGLKAAILAIILQAIIKLSKRALGTAFHAVMALGAFIALYIFALPFPMVIMGAASLGWLCYRSSAISDNVIDKNSADVKAPPLSKLTIAALLMAWIIPLGSIVYWLSLDSVYAEIGLLFSKMSLVTFGGAYAALAYVGQEAVNVYGWMQPSEMLDGLAMAETTPGPLVIVFQHVGFLAAYRDAAILPPMAAGILGGLLAVWVTFIPCFLWIFLWGPWIEKLQNMHSLSSALSAITAAVVGVIANIALWFALHYIFTDIIVWDYRPIKMIWPNLASMDIAALLLTSSACLALFKFHLNIFLLIGLFACLGLMLQFFGLL